MIKPLFVVYFLEYEDDRPSAVYLTSIVDVDRTMRSMRDSGFTCWVEPVKD